LTAVVGSGAVLLPSGGSGAVLTALDNDRGSWEKIADTPQTIAYVGSVYSKQRMCFMCLGVMVIMIFGNMIIKIIGF
jgi:hypothetical protein